MSLQSKLDAYRAEFSGKRPQHIVDAMEAATAWLAASGQAQTALNVGDLAPGFALPGPDGEMVTLIDLLAHGPLVITFYRGVWCPYCNIELQALQEALPQIQAIGGSLLAISPESASNSRKSIRQNELSFPILTDAGNDIAAAFGLRFRLPDDLIAIYRGFGNDLEKVNGDASWTLPMPARYVLATSGHIVYAAINADYTRRPDPADMLPALRHAAKQMAS